MKTKTIEEVLEEYVAENAEQIESFRAGDTRRGNRGRGGAPYFQVPARSFLRRRLRQGLRLRARRHRGLFQRQISTSPRPSRFIPRWRCDEKECPAQGEVVEDDGNCRQCGNKLTEREASEGTICDRCWEVRSDYLRILDYDEFEEEEDDIYTCEFCGGEYSYDGGWSTCDCPDRWGTAESEDEASRKPKKPRPSSMSWPLSSPARRPAKPNCRANSSSPTPPARTTKPSQACTGSLCPGAARGPAKTR